MYISDANTHFNDDDEDVKHAYIDFVPWAKEKLDPDTNQ